MEGQRFFDLRRWEPAYVDSVIPGFVAKEDTRRIFLASAATFAPRHHLYPIPSIQIELSKVGSTSASQQNTGWQESRSAAPDRRRPQGRAVIANEHGAPCGRLA